MSDDEFASAALARMEAQERAEYETRRKAKIEAGLDPGEPRKPRPTGRGRQPVNVTDPPAPAPEPQPDRSVLDTPWFEQAAAEAREESKRYWAKGGEADRKYPQKPQPWWPLTGDDADAEEQAKRRQPRKWKRGK